MKAKSMHVEFRNGNRMFLGDYFPNTQLLKDCVEDSRTPQDLERELNKVAVNYRADWKLDRVSEDKIRYKFTDKLGNIDYFIIELEENSYINKLKLSLAYAIQYIYEDDSFNCNSHEERVKRIMHLLEITREEYEDIMEVYDNENNM